MRYLKQYIIADDRFWIVLFNMDNNSWKWIDDYHGDEIIKIKMKLTNSKHICVIWDLTL